MRVRTRARACVRARERIRAHCHRLLREILSYEAGWTIWISEEGPPERSHRRTHTIIGLGEIAPPAIRQGSLSLSLSSILPEALGRLDVVREGRFGVYLA